MESNYVGRSRITIDNGGQRIVVEGGLAVPVAESQAAGILVDVGLFLLQVLVRITNVLLWGTLGAFVGFFWALLRKRN